MANVDVYNAVFISLNTLSVVITSALAIAAIISLLNLIKQNSILVKQVNLATEELKYYRELNTPKFKYDELKSNIFRIINKDRKEWTCFIYVQNMKNMACPITEARINMNCNEDIDPGKIEFKDSKGNMDICENMRDEEDLHLWLTKVIYLDPFEMYNMEFKIIGDIVEALETPEVTISCGDWQRECINNILIHNLQF